MIDVDRPAGLSDEEWEPIIARRLQDVAATIPGFRLQTGVTCGAVRPEPPDVPNIHMTECYYLLHHDGDHSWGRA